MKSNRWLLYFGIITPLILGAFILLAPKILQKLSSPDVLELSGHDCKEEKREAIGKVGTAEVRMSHMDCGEDPSYFELSVHSDKVAAEASVQNSVDFSNDSFCDDFEKSLYLNGDILIGCCPYSGPAGSNAQHERVFVMKVKPETGGFDREEFADFMNLSSEIDPKTSKEKQYPSCANRKIKIDYDKIVN